MGKLKAPLQIKKLKKKSSGESNDTCSVQCVILYFRSIYRTLHLFICFSIILSIYVSDYLSTQRNMCLFICLYTFIQISRYLSNQKIKISIQVAQPILVCSAHIHWDPEFCDVKLIQTMMLMEQIRQISDSFMGLNFRY